LGVVETFSVDRRNFAPIAAEIAIELAAMVNSVIMPLEGKATAGSLKAPRKSVIFMRDRFKLRELVEIAREAFEYQAATSGGVFADSGRVLVAENSR